VKKYNFLLFSVLLLVIGLRFVSGATLNGSSSIYNFNVSNCMADIYFVGCSEEIILFSCDVTNKQFINFIEFRIDNNLFNATIIGFNAQLNFLKLNQTFTVNESIVFDRIYITDTNGDKVVFDDSVSVLHDCVTCTDVGYTDSCSVFDNTTVHHVFEPVNCSVDFDEVVSCNYCSQKLVEVLGVCQVNNLQNVSYYDANFFSCCQVTGLITDCFINFYPYNETTIQSCNYLIKDFDCNFPSVAELRSEMPFSCLMNDSVDYRCVVNVFEDNRLLQVNPEFKDYNSGLLTIKGERVEPKQFFTPENRLLNVYFTNKNLLTDKEFMVEVVCSGDGKVFKSQNIVKPFYSSAGGVLNRLVWGRDNATFLIVGFLLVVLIILFVGWSINKFRGGRTSR